MQRVGELLRAFLASRITRDGERMIELVEAWGAVAGDAKPHVKVRDLRGETLVLEADHPGWAQIVSMRKSAILRELERRVPGLPVRSLRVVVGSGGEAPAAAGQGRSPAAEPPEPGPAGMEEALSRVPDEALRRTLRALYEGSRRRPPN